MQKPNIGVIGHTGMVGSEVYKYFLKKKYKVYGLSTIDRNGFVQSPWEDINKYCEIVFVCVPTPFDFTKRKADFSIVRKVIKKIKPGKTVVLKSTVWPGTTDALQKIYPKLKMLFNPEFLSRSTSEADFANPDRQLIGYTTRSKKEADLVSKILPNGKHHKVLKSSEAELIKYAHNVYGSIQIIYANHLYDISKRIGADYDAVRYGFSASDFIGPGILRYMNVFHNGKRGFGGPCFPKDVNSFIEYCHKNKIKIELIEAARNANVRILKSQKMTEKSSEKY